MYRLIYKSRSTDAIDWDFVSQIISSSEESNKEHSISGILLASQTHFLQVIEGTYESVNHAFRRIFKDTRHENLSLISFNVIDARLFRGWGMKGIGIFDFNLELETRLKDKYGVEDDGFLHFPVEEWQVLALFQDIEMMRDLPDWKK